MNKNITNSESISELESKKKSKSQEVWKATIDSIKEILTSNWEKILFTDEEIQAILGNRWKWDSWELDSWELKDIRSKINENIDKDFQYNDIRIIANCLKNLDRTKMKDFIHRKKEYLEKNRTISKEKFEELFWWSWKYWKTEIKQESLWICYAYTWFELLKKTNWFDEIIQTNLKESKNWWEVRIPFCDKKYWEWIKVNKNEIDKEFKSKRWNRIIKTTSQSELLWFKILEIAFIKKEIINRYQELRRSAPKVLENAYYNYIYRNDIPLNLTLLKQVEWWATSSMLNTMLPAWYLLFENIPKWLSKTKDTIFDLFSTGLFKISLWIDWEMDKKIFRTNIMKCLDNDDNIIGITIKDSKIAYKWKSKIESWYTLGDDWLDLIPNTWYKEDSDNYLAPDIITDQNWNKHAIIFRDHAYSIEKCYITPEWEKRVRIINPHNTWIKIDISFEECKTLFNREITWINIDKMFR